jgi:hypothetical protein
VIQRIKRVIRIALFDTSNTDVCSSQYQLSSLRLLSPNTWTETSSTDPVFLHYNLRSYREENTVLCIYVSWHLVAVCGTPTFS